MDAFPFRVADVLGVQRVAADARCADEHVEARQLRDGGVQLRGVANIVAVCEIEDVDIGPSGA